METKNKTSLLLGGRNEHYQLGEDSNNTYDSDPIIKPPCISHINVSNLSSYSIFAAHAIWTTKDGKAYAIGSNKDKRIIGSLPESDLHNDTEVQITDDSGNLCKIISALCGGGWTLYLVSKSDGSKHLAYVFYNQNDGNPLFLNINGPEPIALFGGWTESAAIDSEGGIIIITKYLFESPKSEVKSVFLPDNEKAVSVCFCSTYDSYHKVIALSENGHVYRSNIRSEMKLMIFELVDELKDKEIVNISGIGHYCFAISSDGKAYVYGVDKNGALGLGENINEAKNFTLISSLKSYKIKQVFAGCYHSFFFD